MDSAYAISIFLSNVITGQPDVLDGEVFGERFRQPGGAITIDAILHCIGGLIAQFNRC